MTHRKHSRVMRALLYVFGVTVLFALLTGCGGKDADKPAEQQGQTAKSSLPVAKSALSTMAPDAKLLVVQTAQTVTSTSTPVWAYLFGSPETDKTYVVYVANGNVMNKSEYGTAGLSKSEWTKVPADTEWKIDSNDALNKAKDAGGGEAESYMMGFQTYIPSEAATESAQAMVWYVYLGNQATSAIEVDARTGKVSSK